MNTGAFAALGVVVVGMVFAIVTVKELSIGRDEMAQAEAASGRSDWPNAIAHARLAAEAFVPASPWPDLAMLRLQSIAREAEARGDDETALLAYGAQRTAALATRFPFGNAPRWQASYEEGLARLAAAWSRPRGDAEVPRRLRVDTPPSSSQSMLDALRERPTGSLKLSLVGAASLVVAVSLVRLAWLGGRGKVG